MMRPHPDVTGTVASDADDQAGAGGRQQEAWPRVPRPRTRPALRGAGRLVEAAAQQQRVEQAERRQEYQRTEAERDDRRDQHRATRCGLLDREPRQELGALRQAPAGDHGGDRRRRSHARGPVAPAEDEGDRRDAGEQRDDHGHEPGAARQPVPDRRRVVSDDHEPRGGRDAGGDGRAERAPAERELELAAVEPDRVGSEVDGRQVGRRRDGDDAERDRRLVEPARDEIALGVADRNAPGRDAPDERRRTRRASGSRRPRRRARSCVAHGDRPLPSAAHRPCRAG